ncbi:CAAX prenyl protease 2 [Hondaea fermentalgiana]|uniref:intramembrane prenyl-peptidase Rce1 n=1 Tax=Hondaea fermentalgiana TaxID=2315210 RepID=A0A2R5GZH1_9STRA|nr:CAAX prenyl protease 2 [Hondaea fermentalgiana]|eukprot:GBG33434.1 CAAX prenyl protease 2 [Hondaea fermentalgiana]
MWLEASSAGALLGCASLATIFVGSLYLAPASVRHRGHDDEVQIKWRFRSTAITCILSPLALLFWKVSPEDGNYGSTGPSLFHWIGVRTAGLVDATILPLSLVIVLFTGPLVDMYLIFRRARATGQIEKFTFDQFFPNCPENPVVQIRNLIAAPFAEELVFRCCMGALLKAANWRHAFIIGFAPLFFGVAHLHHCHGMIKEGMPVKRAIIISLVQMTYTTLFGALEMFFFLRTGHLISVFLIHSWCNLLGLPPLGFLGKTHPNHEHAAFIIFGYISGIFIFVMGLGPLTSPELYKNQIYS